MFQHRILQALHIHAQWVLVIVLSTLSILNVFGQAKAADLYNRKVTIGTSRPSEVTTHDFAFNLSTPSVVGSVEFEYCENSPIIGSPCIAPAGLDVSGTALSSQAGETGFSVHANTSANRIVISRVPIVAVPQPASYDFSNIINPSTANDTYFVRIGTFASDDGTGARTDAGSVAFALTDSLTTTGFVPPFLTFCVGLTVAVDCSTATGDFIDFGELLRTNPSTATSQYSGATNDLTGFNVSVHGNTMTSGSNLIPALATNGASSSGTSQYGLNLRQNSSPTIGQNPSGTGTSTVATGYDIANSFRFVSGETISSSPLPTEFNRFTVTYLVNVSQAQQPGIYAATMTYVATASF